MSTVDYLAGRKVLETANSPINGELTVIRELGWGTYIKAGGIPQSGGLAKKIWEKSLKEVKKKKIKIKKVLILGFAGGGIAHIARELWPKCEIFGVDIDPLMVGLGKKHLKWEKTDARVWIQDAEEFMDDLLSTGRPKGEKANDFEVTDIGTQFDLVCVDMYVGNSVPEKFSKVGFVKFVKKLVSDDGIVIFNRLYGANDKGQAEGFQETLKKVFPKIDTVYPAANVMFLCRVVV